MRKPDLGKIMQTIDAVMSAKRAVVQKEAAVMAKLNRYLSYLGYRVVSSAAPVPTTRRRRAKRGRPAKTLRVLKARPGRPPTQPGRPPKIAKMV